MRYTYHAVAHLRDPDDFVYLTTFALVNHIQCSLPSGKEGLLDTVHYIFKPLTLPEFETYIAFETMEVRDSDTFAVSQRDMDGFRAGI
jgi:hypothetical protein